MTSAIPEQLRWTISDLEGFPDNGNRYEIIDGELFVTRAPHWDHQDLVGAIYAELRAWSRRSGLGKAALTPGVIFSESDAVIPDVIWISHERRAQLIDRSGHLTGAPELVVEVLSNTEKDKKRDRETKLKLYSVQGVIEYWIVDREQQLIGSIPNVQEHSCCSLKASFCRSFLGQVAKLGCSQLIEVYRRENGVLKKAMTLFSADQLTSPLLPGFSCEVALLFE